MSRYTIDNIEFPSVTEIIDSCFDKSDALIGWATGEMLKWIRENTNEQMDYKSIMEIVGLSRFKFREVSGNAIDTGTQVHDLIEDYIKFGIDKTSKRDYNDNIKNAFLAFLDWEKVNNIKWVESEIVVYSKEIYVAGRLDAICYYQDKLYCIDFKSSKGFYDGYDLQIAAYPMMYNEMKYSQKIKKPGFKGIEEIVNCGILRLDKESGVPEWKDYSKNLDRKWDAFNKLVDFFYIYKNRRLKNNPRVKII